MSTETSHRHGGYNFPEGWVRTDGVLVPTQTCAEQAVRTLIALMGEDPSREGLQETPQRVVRALWEMTQGYREDPEAILSKVFDEPHDQLIILRGIPFVSLCEHHLLPFLGEVDLGYLPGKVVGLSKLARLVDCYAKRLQIQERLTNQIAQAIAQCLEAQGVACVVRATHSCLSCRGVRKPGAEMITSCMLGTLREDGQARAEFLALCK